MIDDILKPAKFRRLESEYTKKINQTFAVGGGIKITVSETPAGTTAELFIKVNDRNDKTIFPMDYFNRDTRKIIEQKILSHISILLSIE